MMSADNNINYSYNSSPADEILDLSKRRDSVETRKTPSPYNNLSSEASPSNFNSPSRIGCFLMGNLRSPNSSFNGFYSDSPNMKNNNHQPVYNSNAYSTFSDTSSDVSKRETPSPERICSFKTKPHPEDINSYILQAAALQQQLVQARVTNREVKDICRTETNCAQSSPVYHETATPSGTMYPMIVGRDGKLARPFKAYPKDPLSLTSSFTASDIDSTQKYNIFRKRMLDQIHAANGGQPTVSNPKMRRSINKTLYKTSENLSTSEELCHDSEITESILNNSINNCSSAEEKSNHSQKDSSYFERRKKNNAAAKKSRDRRRIKEDEIAIRAAFLERENIELKFELASLKKQLALCSMNATTTTSENR